MSTVVRTAHNGHNGMVLVTSDLDPHGRRSRIYGMDDWVS